MAYVLMSELRTIFNNHTTQQSQSHTPLAAAINLDRTKKNSGLCEANLFALVTGFSAPSRTKRGDWKLNVTLVDQAFDAESTTALTLVIFCRDRKQLPNFSIAGEVLRIHRVVVQEWEGEIQLRGQRSTSYAVYRGGDIFDQDQVVSPSKCNVTSQDGARFCSLWKWGQKWMTNTATIKGTEKRQLAQMRQQTDDGTAGDPMDSALVGDFTVMITAILPMPEDLRSGITPMGFLRVWDGTGLSHSDR